MMIHNTKPGFNNMWQDIKETATFFFYLASIAALAVMIWFLGLVFAIPVIIYIGWKIIQIRKELKQMEQTDEHEETNDTRN